MEKMEGMSFSEFCYPVLQAWDWWHMYDAKGVQLQIGGADQYGNILSGIDAIKHGLKTRREQRDGSLRPITKEEALSAPMGFTAPLLTTASGEKFGKSAGNAVWLDKEQTSVFDLYGVSCSYPHLMAPLTVV
jgi:tyrosyl-tRNA synthetase